MAAVSDDLIKDTVSVADVTECMAHYLLRVKIKHLSTHREGAQISEAEAAAQRALLGPEEPQVETFINAEGEWEERTTAKPADAVKSARFEQIRSKLTVLKYGHVPEPIEKKYANLMAPTDDPSPDEELRTLVKALKTEYTLIPAPGVVAKFQQ